MNTAIDLMGKRLAVNDRKKEITQELKGINRSMQFVVLCEIVKDYPEMVEEYRQGKLSYEDLLKKHSKLESEKIKKMVEELKGKQVEQCQQ